MPSSSDRTQGLAAGIARDLSLKSGRLIKYVLVEKVKVIPWPVPILSLCHSKKAETFKRETRGLGA